MGHRRLVCWIRFAGKFGSSTIAREPNTLIPIGLNPLSIFMTSAISAIVNASVRQKMEFAHRIGEQRPTAGPSQRSFYQPAVKSSLICTVPSAVFVVIGQPQRRKTLSMASLRGSTSAMKPLIPAATAILPRCAIIRPAIPRRWKSSSTMKATSAEPSPSHA